MIAATAVVMPFVGAASIAFITLANATLQLTAAPEMRGRVIALYGVAFLGTTPVGGPIVGWVGEPLLTDLARFRALVGRRAGEAREARA